MNKSIAPMKVAKFDKIINYFSVFIFCFQLILAILLGIIGMIEYLNPQPWYLTRVSLYDRLSWIIFPIRFLLLNSSMIPISLKVTMEISKIFYSFFIEKDPVLYTFFSSLDNLVTRKRRMFILTLPTSPKDWVKLSIQSSLSLSF